MANDLTYLIYQILFFRANSNKKVIYFIELLSVINQNLTKNISKGLKHYIEKLPDYILENQEIF